MSKTPRLLPYRFYYRWYAVTLAIAWGVSLAGIGIILYRYGFQPKHPSSEELWGFVSLAILLPGVYLWWLHPKLTRKVQVFDDRIKIVTKDLAWDLSFNDIEKIERPFSSFIKIVMRDGHGWWFSAAIERPDYLWEGLMKARPELIGGKDKYESFRIELVKYDHHEKRKEWFLRHRLIDVFYWLALPAFALIVGYFVQSNEVIIHSKAFYFFRLLMYSLFALIICAFAWSVILKRFVFDKKIEEKIKNEASKLRDLELEDAVLRKAKIFQTLTCSAVLVGLISADLNLFSITKLKDGAQAFRMSPGKTIVVDNRFNCVSCAHSVKEGDLLIFGRGTLGEVMALPGEVIAQTRQTDVGRSIASETVTEVPEGHVAIKTGASGRDVVLVPISELVGKLKN